MHSRLSLWSLSCVRYGGKVQFSSNLGIPLVQMVRYGSFTKRCSGQKTEQSAHTNNSAQVQEMKKDRAVYVRQSFNSASRAFSHMLAHDIHSACLYIRIWVHVRL